MANTNVSLHAIPGRCFQLYYRHPQTGQIIRKSTRTFDIAEAERLRAKREAELILGIMPASQHALFGPEMSIDDFLDQYQQIYWIGHQLRESSRINALSRVRIVAEAMGAKTLGELATRENLQSVIGTLGLTRERFTVLTYMKSIIAALNWAKEQDWITDVPKVKLPKTSRLKGSKGRPLTAPEFEKLLESLAAIVGPDRQAGYLFGCQLLIETGFRLNELWVLHWTDESYIVPRLDDPDSPTFHISAKHQKNDTEQEIPMTPACRRLLDSVPPENRHGWICNPLGMVRPARIEADRFGKLVSRAGLRAGIIVNKSPQKFASCHDLRRSFAERLIDVGAPPELLREMMRHADIKTTMTFYVGKNIQRSSRTLANLWKPQ